MSVNGLDGPLVREAHQMAAAEPGGWFLLKYASRDELVLLGQGSSGILECRNAVAGYDEKSPLFGFLRYRRRNVILKYLPEECGWAIQARATVHLMAVCEQFVPYNDTFIFTTAKELKDSKLSALCSANASSASISSLTSSLRQRIALETAEEEAEEEKEKEDEEEDEEEEEEEEEKEGDREEEDKVKEGEQGQWASKNRLLEERNGTSTDLSAPSKFNDDFSAARNATANANANEAAAMPTSPVKSINGPARRMSSQSSQLDRPELVGSASFSVYGRQRVKLAPRPSVDAGRPRTSQATFRPVSQLPSGFKLFGRTGSKRTKSRESNEIPEAETDLFNQAAEIAEFTFDPTTTVPIPENSTFDPLAQTQHYYQQQQPQQPQSQQQDAAIMRPHTSSGAGISSGRMARPGSSAGLSVRSTAQSTKATMTPEKARLMKAMKLREKRKKISEAATSEAAITMTTTKTTTTTTPTAAIVETSQTETQIENRAEKQAENNTDTQAEHEPESKADNLNQSQHHDQDQSSNRNAEGDGADAAVVVEPSVSNDQVSEVTQPTDSRPASPTLASSEPDQSTKASSLSGSTHETVQQKGGLETEDVDGNNNGSNNGHNNGNDIKNSTGNNTDGENHENHENHIDNNDDNNNVNNNSTNNNNINNNKEGVDKDEIELTSESKPTAAASEHEEMEIPIALDTKSQSYQPAQPEIPDDQRVSSNPPARSQGPLQAPTINTTALDAQREDQSKSPNSVSLLMSIPPQFTVPEQPASSSPVMDGTVASSTLAAVDTATNATDATDQHEEDQDVAVSAPAPPAGTDARVAAMTTNDTDADANHADADADADAGAVSDADVDADADDAVADAVAEAVDANTVSAAPAIAPVAIHVATPTAVASLLQIPTSKFSLSPVDPEMRPATAPSPGSTAIVSGPIDTSLSSSSPSGSPEFQRVDHNGSLVIAPEAGVRSKIDDSESLIEELDMATVYEALPIPVTRSSSTPRTPLLSDSPGQPMNMMEGGSSYAVRTVSNPVRGTLLAPVNVTQSSARSVSTGAAFVHNIARQKPASNNLALKKGGNVGSGILQRLAKFEKLTTPAGGPATEGPRATPSSAFYAVGKASTSRSTSRAPSVVDRTQSLTRQGQPMSGSELPSHDSLSAESHARTLSRDRPVSLANRLSMFETPTPLAAIANAGVAGGATRGRTESVQVTARIVRDPNESPVKGLEPPRDLSELGHLDLKQSQIVIDHQITAYPVPSSSTALPPFVEPARDALLERRLSSRGHRNRSPDKEGARDDDDAVKGSRSSLTVVRDFIKDRRKSLSSPSTDTLAVPTPGSPRSSSRPRSTQHNGAATAVTSTSSLPRRLSISSRRSSISRDSATPSGALSPSNLTEGSVSGDESKSTDKKPKSRTGRFMRRLSSSLSSSGSSRKTPTHISPTLREEEDDGLYPDRLMSSNASALASTTSVFGSAIPAPSRPAAIVAYMGDVNVQFPDTLLWKRRAMCVDSAGFLVLSTTAPGIPPSSSGRGAAVVATGTRRFHVGEFREPYTPEMEVQELPNSVVLDFTSGAAGLQLACEDRAGQLNVLHTLQDAHKMHAAEYRK